jgi:hypothetical protein
MPAHLLSSSAKLLPSAALKSSHLQPGTYTRACCSLPAARQLNLSRPVTYSPGRQTPSFRLLGSSGSRTLAFTSHSFQTADMSTMKAQHGHSEACCNIPPVSHTYSEKGSYEEIDGRKSCKRAASAHILSLSASDVLTVLTDNGVVAQTSLAPAMRRRASSSSLTSLATMRRRCRVPTSWPRPTTM